MNLSKVRKFFSGRRGQFGRIEAALRDESAPIIWVHSASYGEFEEARPVLAAIRAARPEYRFLVTFFSPSGYEFLKNDPDIDYVFYLPLDTRRNARRFLDLVRPERMILSISDYWLHFLHELRRRQIPAYLVSGRFLPSMIYFKPIGRMYLNTLRTCFTRIIVHSESSLRVLEAAGLQNGMLVGDPRMDRVAELAREPWSDALVERWCGGEKVFVAGSTLPDEDDECIIAAANAHPGDKFMIIPHEQLPSEMDHLCAAIHGKVIRYTDPGESPEDAQVLIVDTVGMLSRLYRYGFAAFVGAGFNGESVHSVIEPAVYGIPVAFGPIFGTQLHCGNLVAAGAASAVHNPQEFCDWYGRLKADPGLLAAMGEAAASYCRQGSGVAEAIAKEVLSDSHQTA